jgi:hypothetical protein
MMPIAFFGISSGRFFRLAGMLDLIPGLGKFVKTRILPSGVSKS